MLLFFNVVIVVIFFQTMLSFALSRYIINIYIDIAIKHVSIIVQDL